MIARVMDIIQQYFILFSALLLVTQLRRLRDEEWEDFELTCDVSYPPKERLLRNVIHFANAPTELNNQMAEINSNATVQLFNL